MKNRIKKVIISISFLILIGVITISVIKIHNIMDDRKNGIGNVIDSYKGVDIYFNGYDYGKNHGKSYSKDKYYYGYKWQCVEYVKRFYYEAKHHKMPDVYGNAKDFFDENIEQGELNEKRGLYQYKNGGNVKPCEDDLLVFTDTTYGHVVIISEVGDDYIEVVQQNMGDESRDRFELKCIDGNYYVGGKREPAGWLRLE
ncbi:CHAP domain-containing protein [uncultured Clostridium sp.]|uniref:CHAP domain-containing protein n=1 Tax=uncultured Clostridium sp. TaxID=59620 RepID=UPI0025DFCF29|nr:CHAP domain-containing protein [uncultured Clostridium sp.]